MANPFERQIARLRAELVNAEECKNEARAVRERARRTGDAAAQRKAEQEFREWFNRCQEIGRQLEALGDRITWRP